METMATFLFLLITILLFAAAFAGLKKTAGTTTAFIGAAIMLGWLGLQAVLAFQGFYENFSTLPPRFLLTFAPPTVFILWVVFSKRTAVWVNQLPAAALNGLQGFRILMEIVLWLLFGAGIIPVQMTFEGYNFDIVSGILGAVVGVLLLRSVRLPKGIIIAWNVLGLLLVLTIVGISAVSTPSPLRVFMNEPANTLIASWPYVWLPAFVVPMAMLLHVLAIKKALAGK